MIVGKSAICIENQHYSFTKGNEYVILKYTPPYKEGSFTWAAYVTVIDDYGRTVTCHAARFFQNVNTRSQNAIPAIGQHWPEQGGIYIGSRVIDNRVHHVVIPGGVDHDIAGVKFENVEKVIPKEINGFTDWRAPDQEDLMLAYINARGRFVRVGGDSIYWSCITHNNLPWAVDFANGCTNYVLRRNEFRVRPFRKFTVDKS